jgi:hypothetical protein
MRDSQRQKVYNSERQVNAYLRESDLLVTVTEIQVFVNSIITSSWLRKHFSRLPILLSNNIEVRPGKGRRNAAGASWAIWMPLWSRYKIIILHELSHSLCANMGFSKYKTDFAPHGWQFCGVLLALVKKYLGEDDFLDLKDKFKKNRVRFTAPAKNKGKKPMPLACVEALKKYREEKYGIRNAANVYSGVSGIDTYSGGQHVISTSTNVASI